MQQFLNSTTLIARWPGNIKPGTVIDELCLSMDWFSTLVALGRVEFDASPKLDGINLEPALAGTGSLPARAVFWQTGKAAAVRKGSFIWIAPDGNEESGQLYDLKKDLRETSDIAAQHPDLVAEMQQAYLNWRNEVWDGVKPVAQ